MNKSMVQLANRLRTEGMRGFGGRNGEGERGVVVVWCLTLAALFQSRCSVFIKAHFTWFHAARLGALFDLNLNWSL